MNDFQSKPAVVVANLRKLDFDKTYALLKTVQSSWRKFVAQSISSESWELFPCFKLNEIPLYLLDHDRPEDPLQKSGMQKVGLCHLFWRTFCPKIPFRCFKWCCWVRAQKQISKAWSNHCRVWQLLGQTHQRPQGLRGLPPGVVFFWGGIKPPLDAKMWCLVIIFWGSEYSTPSREWFLWQMCWGLVLLEPGVLGIWKLSRKIPGGEGRCSAIGHPAESTCWTAGGAEGWISGVSETPKKKGGGGIFEIQKRTGWWFQIFFIFNPTWGNDPISLIFFRWVPTTNQRIIARVWLCIGSGISKPPLLRSHDSLLDAIWTGFGSHVADGSRAIAEKVNVFLKPFASFSLVNPKIFTAGEGEKKLPIKD